MLLKLASGPLYSVNLMWNPRKKWKENGGSLQSSGNVNHLSLDMSDEPFLFAFTRYICFHLVPSKEGAYFCGEFDGG